MRQGFWPTWTPTATPRSSWRAVTAFSDAEEDAAGTRSASPFSLQEELAALGAIVEVAAPGRHPRPARAIAAPPQRHFSAAQQDDAGSSPSRASKGKKAMRLPRRIAGLLMAAGMAAGITTAAVPAHADPSYYVIETTTYLDTGGVPLCLEGDPAPDWAYRVTTQPCNVQNNRAQQWEFQSQGGGVIKVANRAISGWCIEANAIANGSAVPLWPCSSTESNLRWVFVDYGIGFGRLESRISGSTGHCLDVPMGQTLPGLWMQVYGCNFTNAQRFFAGLLPA